MSDRRSDRERAPTPTFVLDRRGKGEPAPRAGGLEELGLFRLGHEVAEAPGAWLFSGTSRDGERVLLHLLRLRAAPTEDAWNERAAYERALGAATTALSSSGAAQIFSHGVIDGERGERVLFWALPWCPGIAALESLGQIPLGHAEIGAIGLSLARTLAERHEREHVAPNLTEEALVLGPDRRSATIAGVPLVFASDWLAPGMAASRLAPEEQDGGVATPRGDLWRLGCTLKVLSAGATGEPPGALLTLLRALTEPDPRRRLRRASDAANELRALAEDPGDDAPTVRKVVMVAAPTVSGTPAAAPKRDADFAVDERGWFFSTEEASLPELALAQAPREVPVIRGQALSPVPRLSVAPRKRRRPPGPRFWIASSALGIAAGAVASFLSAWL